MRRTMVTPARLPCALALSFLLSHLPAAAQKAAPLPQDTLAWVGPGVITAGDLIQRMELMPFPDRQKGAESLKVMTLRAMIAEKVLAGEKKRLGLPDDRESLLMRHALENALIRDELYRQQVLERAAPGRGEAAEGMKRFVKVNRVISFLVPSRSSGEELAGMLKSARPRNLLRGIPGSLYTQRDTITIKFGATDTAFESAAYAIGPSRVSQPFFSSIFGWAVLYLLDRTSNPDAAKMDQAGRPRQVEKILRARHEAARYEEYYREVLAPHAGMADSAIFRMLADSLAALWGEDTTHFTSRGMFILTGDMVELLASRLHGHLDSVFVRLDGGNLTLGEVLEMMRYADVRSKEREGLQFMKNLNGEVKDLVGQELLAREGRKAGLQFTPSVQKDLALWSDYWGARDLYYRVRDSVTVSDGEILGHLVRFKEIFGRYYEVNLREVLCDSLTSMGVVLDALGRGEAFSAVAAKHSRRGAWAREGGVSGWFSVGVHPALGFEAMNADTGRIVGPVRLAEGWSLFQVLGKRLAKDGKVGFDVLKRNVRTRLLGEKRTLTLDGYIADLVRQQRVVIDAGKLARITVTRIPMFTRRLIGFGGRMAASPMLMKAWDWARRPAPPDAMVP